MREIINQIIFLIGWLTIYGWMCRNVLKVIKKFFPIKKDDPCASGCNCKDGE